MSGRPRPVTATFQPAGMEPVTGVRSRSYSLSSGSSTASLVSVLDHDSYESLEDSDQEVDHTLQTQGKEGSDTFISSSKGVEQSGKDGKPRLGQRHIVRHTADSFRSEGHVETARSQVAWEDWIVRKAKETLKEQKKEQQRLEKERKAEELKRQEKEEKLKQAEKKIKDWVEKKNLSEKLQKRMAIKQEETKKELEEDTEKAKSEKAKIVYRKWLKTKLNKEKELKEKEEEKKKEDEARKLEKEKKCEETYKEWCKKATNRPKSSHSSFGYTSGKLTGYFDGSSYPAPTFVNPLPWQPVEVPKSKTQKKKHKAPNKWNPDKYF